MKRGCCRTARGSASTRVCSTRPTNGSREAEKAFAEIGDFGGLGFVRGLLGFVRMFQGRFEEAGELAEYILANERDRNDKWALGMILLLLSSVKLFTGKPDEAIAPASEAIELFTTIGDPDRLLQAKGTKARSLASVGRIDEAIALLKDIDTSQGGDGNGGFGVIAASVGMQLGEPTMTRAALASETALARMMGTVADHELRLLTGVAELLAGNYAEARSMLEESVALASNEGQVAYANGALAIAYAADRQPKLALDAADRSIAAKGGTYLDRQLARTGQALAFAQQDDRRALTVADELVKRANESSDAVAQSTALLVRASVAQALRSDDATGYAEEADEALDQLGADLPGWRDVFSFAATPASRLDT